VAVTVAASRSAISSNGRGVFNATLTGMAIATPADVAAVLGRELTPDEQTAVTRRIQAAVGVLEGVLHRTLELDTFAETYVPDPQGHVPSSAASGWSTLRPGSGVIHLHRRPVAAVTSAVTTSSSLDTDADPGSDITASCRLVRDTLIVPTLKPVEVTYTAGDDPVAPQAAMVITNAVARDLMVPAPVAAGIDFNYNVEGTSVNYGRTGALTDGRYGPFTPEEITGLRASLGRLVVR
jgi:hypothetical protein